MPSITPPDEKTIQTLLTQAATMYEIAANQRKIAVTVARNNGWAYERIAEHIGRSYPATRAIAISYEVDAA